MTERLKQILNNLHKYNPGNLAYVNFGLDGMILGLAGALALKGEAQEAIELIERGLPISQNEKQKATMRATLCFLYLDCGKKDKAEKLASKLPHATESREAIQPVIQRNLNDEAIAGNIRTLLLG